MIPLLDLVPAAAFSMLPVEVLRGLPAVVVNDQERFDALFEAVCASKDDVAAILFAYNCDINLPQLFLSSVLTVLLADDSKPQRTATKGRILRSDLQKVLLPTLGPCTAFRSISEPYPGTWSRVYTLLNAPPETVTYEDACTVSALSHVLGSGVHPDFSGAKGVEWSPELSAKFLEVVKRRLRKTRFKDTSLGKKARVWSSSAFAYYLNTSISSLETEVALRGFTVDQWGRFFGLWPTPENSGRSLHNAILAVSSA